MKNYDLGICLLAQNCEKNLIKNKIQIEKLRESFSSSFVYVFENDSQDKTKKILNDWKNESLEIYLELQDNLKFNTKLSSKKDTAKLNKNCSFKRIDKMAFLRNKYMDFIRENDFFPRLLVVIDIDLKKINYKNILKSIENAPNNWKALFANGRVYFPVIHTLGRYYDTFAYIPYEEQKYQTWKQTFLNNDKLNTLLKKNKYVQCESAFGGIGIYRYKYLQNHRYFTEENINSECMEALCEHISVNLISELKNGKYISKDMIVYYQPIKDFTNFICSVFSNKFFIKVWEFFNKKFFPL